MAEQFPVNWADPSDASVIWRRDRWHFPEAATPLSGELFRDVGVGFSRAMAAQGEPFRSVIRRINTYMYIGVRPTLPSDPPARPGARVPGKFENHLTWDTEWLPEIQGYHARWEAFDRASATPAELHAHLQEALEWSRRCWEIHAYLDFSIEGLIEFCGRELAWEMPATERLVAGIANKSLESDDRLRQLAAMVRDSPTLLAAFTANSARTVLAGLPAAGAGAAFREALEAFLAEFGQRSDNIHELALPSWIEDPSPVAALIRAYVTNPERDHAAMRAGLVARREAAVAEARGLLAAKPPETRAQFEQELVHATRSSELNETHNYWIDQRVSFWLRQDFLAAGRLFAGAGLIDAPEDVFYLEIPEVESGLQGGLEGARSLIESRKAEMAHFASIEPPNELGVRAPAAMSAGMDLAFGGHERSDSATELRGQPGSPGVVTGRARIIENLVDSDALEPGDILVAKTTSPPWTPLFGIAAGVVTDAGGALSHCAIVAREYGIPCVVGCVDATARIADGDIITVDGDAGIIRLG